MSLSRIVLDQETRSTVDAIQQRTRTTSPSAAIALMVSRYGRHLLETWELTADRCPEPPIMQHLPSATAASAPTVPPQSASAEFSFRESIEL